MAVTRQQLEQQLVAAHRTKNVQAAQQAAYAIRAYDQNVLSAQVPSINAPPPIDRVPKPSFGSWLGNVTAGIGEGLGEQVQGLGGAIQRGVTAFAQDPLKASAAAFMTALEPARQGFTQPVQAAKDVGTGIVETGKQMYQQATSGPIGLGQTIGQMIDLPGPSLPGGKRRPTTAELDVYHGTPHTFDPEEGAPLGRFRSEKIGTGEGAQAYGYGLYFSEAPSVAKTYQGSVSAIHKSGVPTIEGKPINWDDPRETAAFELSRHNGDRVAAADFHARMFLGGEDNPAVKLLRSNEPLPTVDMPGRLYQVDLPDAKIEQMLDWDKPLAEQPEAIRKALSSHPKVIAEVNRLNEQRVALNEQNPERLSHPVIGKLARKEYTAESLKGQALYELFSKGSNQAQASEYMRSLGIPGIKYLDAGSRAGEKGTRNFVVFPGEEQNLTILERDGVKAKAPEPKDLSFTDALSNLVRPDLEDDQVFSKPLPPADADNLDYVGKFGASATGTGGMHVSVRDEVKDAGPHEFFFYDNNDEPLGFARLTKNKKQASINMIAFNEEGRGRGLGKSFYKYLLDDLDVEVKSDKEITQGTARIYESLAKEYPTRVDYDGRVVISPKYK